MELESGHILDMGVLIVHIYNQMWVKFIDLWQNFTEHLMFDIYASHFAS